MNENKNEVFEVKKEKKTAKERWSEFKNSKTGKVIVSAGKFVIGAVATAAGALIVMGLYEKVTEKHNSNETSEEIIDVPADTVEVVEDTTVE